MPLEAMRARLLTSGMPTWHVDVQTDFALALEAGHASTVTDAVEAVTGRPPRTVEEFIREHLTLFIG
jgi:NAD(P)H dehydrogenase (quinone)